MNDSGPRRRAWWRRLAGLTASEWRMLLEAQHLLLRFQIRRYRVPAGELVRTGEDAAGRPHSSGEIARARALGWAIERAGRYGLIRPRCLVRSLALQEMLRRHGLPDAHCRIGVRREGGRFEAHAWVELDGRVIGDSAEWVARFTPTTDRRFVPR